MFRSNGRKRFRRRGHLGVWDPTGGEARAGSGLPVEEGEEKVRILARDVEGAVREVSADGLADALSGAGAVVWIDLLRPRGRSEEILRDVLALSPLTVEDCLSPLRMPKIDAFPDGSGAFVAAFAARVGDRSEPRLRAIEVNLVIGTGYLVTVRDGPVMEVEETLEARLRSGDPLPEVAGAVLAHAVLDALTDGQLPALVSTAEQAEGLEEGLDPRYDRRSARALEDLILLRQNLLSFRRLAVAQQEVLKRLGRSAPAVKEYLSDVEDNQREAVDMADATQDYVEGIIETYRLRRDERSEHAVRRLTVLAGIIGPLTLISGIYGANFARIPGAESPVGFWVFVGAQVLFAVIAVWFLYRRGLF